MQRAAHVADGLILLVVALDFGPLHALYAINGVLQLVKTVMHFDKLLIYGSKASGRLALFRHNHSL
jgi:hypothetical protein